MSQIETSFQKMLNDTSFFDDNYYSGLYNSLYKYSMELLYDGYDIPDKYIISENRVMHQFPKIYKRLAKRGDFNLIKKMLKLNRNNFIHNNASYVMRGAAKTGNITILKWMRQNNYPFDEFIAASAAQANQIETLKWLIDNSCKIPEFIASRAAKKGHIEILKFI